MTDRSKPKIQNLEGQEAEELTPEEAEAARGSRGAHIPEVTIELWRAGSPTDPPPPPPPK